VAEYAPDALAEKLGDVAAGFVGARGHGTS
jgi:hypothetical protein